MLYWWLIILYRSFYSPIVHQWYLLLAILAYLMLRYSRDWFPLIFIGNFFVPDQNFDISHPSFFQMWLYTHNFTTNQPLILYLIFEINLCSLIIFSWLMLIKCVIFESNIDVWEWLLGTLLTRAMKGTSQCKYNTLLRLVIEKVFLLCLGLSLMLLLVTVTQPLSKSLV